MMGVTKLMQNKRFIQCPSFGRWFMSRTWGVRCNILWKLFHSCTLGMSWRTSEYSWAYRDGKPGLPCLAWRATILEIFVTGCTWPRNIPARSVNWVQGAASDNETGFRTVMWLGLKRRSSDSSSFSYAKFTHMDHFRKVVDCEEAGLIFNCIDSLLLWKS